MNEMKEVYKNKDEYENFEIRVLAFIVMFGGSVALVLFAAYHWLLFSFKAFYSLYP